MKILVFLHELVLGGTTVNAIELAAALRDLHGHEVVFFATPGPLQQMVADHGLRLIPAPVVTRHPSPARMRALRQAIRDEKPDLLHVWETWPAIDAYYAAHLPWGTPMVLTDMQMLLQRVLPRSLHTTFGTPELVRQAQAAGHPHATLLLPPVDTRINAPGRTPCDGFRQQWSVSPAEITLVTVSRLEDSMKGESLTYSLQAVRSLGRELPLRLLVVGDGTARSRLAQLAAEVNAEVGREVVTLTGAMRDPRAAYAAADIVLGMGSSALRALAYGKPLIVLGERGFALGFTRDSAAQFMHTGFYGSGHGAQCADLLAQAIRQFAAQPQQLQGLGEFSREFVVEHYSLEVISQQLHAVCVAALAAPKRLPRTVLDALRTTAIYLRERRFGRRASTSTAMSFRDDTPARLAGLPTESKG